ncbi:MAG: MBL fold metallo-hydrolase, partial [Paraclostridium sp.]
MLKFLGKGGAFDDKINSCAYFEYADELYLIDCGENTFQSIKNLIDLNDYKRVNVLITHTHADHVNGLSTLCHYLYYIKKIPMDIKVHTDLYYSIDRLMSINGNYNYQYNIHKFNCQTIISSSYGNLYFGYIKTKHVDNLDCFGILIRHKDDVIYYSGDSCDIPETILDRFSLNKHIAKITHYYQDLSKHHYEGNVHMSIEVFNEKVLPFIKDKNMKITFY